MRFHRRKRAEIDPELAAAREALLIVVASFRDRLEQIMGELEWLRAEVGILRTELAAVPGKCDAATTRAALELVHENGAQVGILRQQLAALDHPEALIGLAGEMVADGALELLNSGTGGDDV